MIDREEVLLLIGQAELNLRNLRSEVNELGRSLDAIRRVF